MHRDKLNVMRLSNEELNFVVPSLLPPCSLCPLWLIYWFCRCVRSGANSCHSCALASVPR
jgi:hypothetical protein